MAGMEGWQGWEMRKSEHLDSQTTAPCLYSRHVLDSIITGPRADGRIGTRAQYLRTQPASSAQVWGRRPAGSNVPTKVPSILVY